MQPESKKASFTNRHQRLDLFFKYTIIIVVALFTLYVAKDLFIPLFYGLFLAIILYPFCRWLEQHSFTRSAAIAASLLVTMLFIALLVWLIKFQLGMFLHDFSTLKHRIVPAINNLQLWIQQNFYISINDQKTGWHDAFKQIISSAGAVFSGTINRTISTVFIFFLTPIFATLFLYNRKDFVLFIEKIVITKNEAFTKQILHQAIGTYAHFIKGMVIVYFFVGVLNSTGLLLLGIKHAVLFGFLTAIMTIIPYLGIAISALLPITVAWITNDSAWYPAGVIAVFAFVQYIEANIIFPKVVGANLNISTMATLIAVIGGGVLWGLSGMILFIPLTGITKIITDQCPEWEALNILLRRNAD